MMRRVPERKQQSKGPKDYASWWVQGRCSVHRENSREVAETDEAKGRQRHTGHAGGLDFTLTGGEALPLLQEVKKRIHRH